MGQLRYAETRLYNMKRSRCCVMLHINVCKEYWNSYIFLKSSEWIFYLDKINFKKNLSIIINSSINRNHNEEIIIISVTNFIDLFSSVKILFMSLTNLCTNFFSDAVSYCLAWSNYTNILNIIKFIWYSEIYLILDSIIKRFFFLIYFVQ